VAEKVGREDIRRQLGGLIIKTAIRKRNEALQILL
jgi:hypothetical protein